MKKLVKQIKLKKKKMNRDAMYLQIVRRIGMKPAHKSPHSMGYFTTDHLEKILKLLNNK